MAKYSSKPAVVSASAADIYGRLTDMEAYQQRLASIPEEQRKQLGDIKITNDSISINTPQLGNITLDVVERVENERVVLSAVQSPVPLTLAVTLEAKGEAETQVQSVVDVDIPAMLRPLIGGKLQEAAEKFNEMILSMGK